MELIFPSILILLVKTSGTKFAWGWWGREKRNDATYRFLEFGINFISGHLGFAFSIQLNPKLTF